MVPPEVNLAEAAPMIHHRTPQFSQIFMDVTEGMKALFETKEADVFILASSGTGAMETSVVNLLSPGDKALFISVGKFGERWGELLKAYGCQGVELKAEYGRVISAKEVADALAKHPDAKALFTTQSETSTGVVSDIEGYAALTRKTGTLLVVDTVSSLGVHPLRFDAWGVDVAVTGSQKGCMLPPGLGFIAVAPRVWKAVEQSKLPKYYFSLPAMKKAIADKTTAYTPAITLIRAAKVALDMLMAEGLENVYARHAMLAEASRAGVKALGLKLFTKEGESNVLTAVEAPEGIKIDAVIKRMRDEFGITLTGGQGSMKGRIFRLGHMGYVNQFDILAALGALEKALSDAGYPVKPGSALAAAQEVFLKSKS